MKIIDNDNIEKTSNEFFEDICKRKDSSNALNQIDLLRRMRECFDSKELFLLFIITIIKPLDEIKNNESDILTDLSYSIKEYNKDISFMDKETIKKIEKAEDCFNSRNHFLYFYYEAIKLGLK